MTRNLFSRYASDDNNPDWENHIERETQLYHRKSDIRSEYERDYTRILHSLAYRRLKHKTQVFFNIDNDHICTRMEHVQHVESVSCTIAKFLGLNVDLTRAIAMGHDLGHAPFGHEGEVELTRIRKDFGMDRFWHERNSLRIIDNIELLEDDKSELKNLDLTYAVRDGIISHCGEVDENGIFPRKEKIDLDTFCEPGQFQAYTWEGCVVKVSDKIAYLGRDIEDAVRINFIGEKEINLTAKEFDLLELLACNPNKVYSRETLLEYVWGNKGMVKISQKYGVETINTTVIIHNFITSICENSSPQQGIRLSDKYNKMLKEIKDFNYTAIYKNEKFKVYRDYVALVIRSIFNTLMKTYDVCNPYKSLDNIDCMKEAYPMLAGDFYKHIKVYSNIQGDNEKYKNKKIYGNIETKEIYAQAIIDYISGMTDRYAVEIFNELLKY